jgi:hypothetical protein
VKTVLFTTPSIRIPDVFGFLFARYLLFSTFPPKGSKDMLSLLDHPALDLAVEVLPGSPLEIPDQESAFLYTLRRRRE